MDQEIQKAKDLITKSEHIALLLPERPDIDCYAAAEAIARAAAQSHKHVGFLPSIAADAVKAPDACTAVLNPRRLIREFIIGIATNAIPVAQLRYEKHDGRIDIILSPQSSPIREDSFSFREGKILCDSIIALNVADIETLPALADTDPAFFTETPIIAVGNSPDQKPYGEVNIISSPSVPLSESAAGILSALAPASPSAGTLPDADTATLLLAGIIAHTHAFRAPLEPGTHTAAARLLERGADQSRANAIAEADGSFSVRQLVARAMVRSKEDTDKNILWSFLTAEDFEKTGRTPADAARVSTALAQAFSPRRVSVLLWQDTDAKLVHATLLGERTLLDTIQSHEPGAFQSPSLTLAADFVSFHEAEEHIASLLREIL